MFLLKKINKIALGSDDDKRMQSIDLIETHAYGMNKDLVFNSVTSRGHWCPIHLNACNP